MNITLQSIKSIGVDTYEFTFESAQPVEYAAGQFVEIALPHSSPDNRGARRWFTLSSAPEESVLKIATRKPTHTSSFKTALFAMKPGDSLEVSQAMGDFVLPRQRTIPILFIAAGIGITPVRSIATSVSLENEQRMLELIYISRDASPAYSAEIADYIPSMQLLRPDTSVAECITYVANSVAAQPDMRIYISGPEQFVETMQAELRTVINPSRLVTDFFHGYN